MRILQLPGLAFFENRRAKRFLSDFLCTLGDLEPGMSEMIGDHSKAVTVMGVEHTGVGGYVNLSYASDPGAPLPNQDMLGSGWHWFFDGNHIWYDVVIWIQKGRFSCLEFVTPLTTTTKVKFGTWKYSTVSWYLDISCDNFEEYLFSELPKFKKFFFKTFGKDDVEQKYWVMGELAAFFKKHWLDDGGVNEIGQSVLDKIREIYAKEDESLKDLVTVGFLECLLSKNQNSMKKLLDSLPSDELKECLRDLLVFWYRPTGIDLLYEGMPPPVFPEGSKNRLYETVESYLSWDIETGRFSCEYYSQYFDRDFEFDDGEKSTFSQIRELCNRLATFPWEPAEESFYVSAKFFRDQVETSFRKLGRGAFDFPCPAVFEAGGLSQRPWVLCPTCSNLFEDDGKSMIRCHECGLLMHNPYATPRAWLVDFDLLKWIEVYARIVISAVRSKNRDSIVSALSRFHEFCRLAESKAREQKDSLNVTSTDRAMPQSKRDENAFAEGMSLVSGLFAWESFIEEDVAEAYEICTELVSHISFIEASEHKDDLIFEIILEVFDHLLPNHLASFADRPNPFLAPIPQPW